MALTPEMVPPLVRMGHQVVVEAGAGTAAQYADAAYSEAGADTEADTARVVRGADVVLAVRLPDASVCRAMRPGTVLVGLFSPQGQPEAMAELAQQGVAVFSLDAMPRISRAQSMDVLSAMSTVSGYRAVIVAAQLAERFLPLLMTAAGTIPPARGGAGRGRGRPAGGRHRTPARRGRAGF